MDMNMDNLVSIIMPAYNLEQYIAESIESVQYQRYSYWELLVVNDGSTDRTVEIVATIAAKDSRIRLINQPNGGSASARNRGLTEARGRYIAFLDGDDLWDSTFLSRLLEAKEQASADMAYCGYTHLYEYGLKSKFSYPYVSGDILPDVIKGGTQVHIGCLITDKVLIDKYGIRFTDGCLIGQDQEFIIALVSVARVEAVQAELMLYRIRMGSAINSKWDWKKHIHAIWGLKRSGEFALKQREGSPGYLQLTAVLRQRLAFKCYKFLWRMLKAGQLDDAARLLGEPDFGGYLELLDKASLKPVDKLKHAIVTGQNRTVWNIVKSLKFI